MPTQEEIEAAIRAIEQVAVMADTYTVTGGDAAALALAALEAAERVRVGQQES